MSKFKALITEEKTEITGKPLEVLAGLVCYINAIKEKGVSDNTIRRVVNEVALKDTKVAETIIDNDKMKVQKFDLNNMSKEEAKNF